MSASSSGPSCSAVSAFPSTTWIRPRCAACGRTTCSRRSSAARTASQSRRRSRASSSAAQPSVGWRSASAPTPASCHTTCSWSRPAPPRRSSFPTSRFGRCAVSSWTWGRLMRFRPIFRWSSRRRAGSISAGAADTLRLAMPEAEPRWGSNEVVDDAIVEDKRRRLAHRYPPGAGAAVVRAWAGLYDMTPDAHPIIGWVGDGVYAACGFSGHGFMQSPGRGPRRRRGVTRSEPQRRPFSVPARALLRRRDLPRDACALSRDVLALLLRP